MIKTIKHDDMRIFEIDCVDYNINLNNKLIWQWINFFFVRVE